MDNEILEQLNSLKIEHIAKKILQDQEKQSKGKYKHVPKSIDKNGVEYSVTEYVCPNKEAGFDIIFCKEIDGKKYTKKICYGYEAASRQHDWAEEIIN